MNDQPVSRELLREAKDSLDLYDEVGDYEAPIAVLRDILAALNSDPQECERCGGTRQVGSGVRPYVEPCPDCKPDTEDALNQSVPRDDGIPISKPDAEERPKKRSSGLFPDRCGGTGKRRKRPSAVNGLTIYACSGCPDCKPDTEEPGERCEDPLSRCPSCGNHRDTPMHELGCERGRAERATDQSHSTPQPTEEPQMGSSGNSERGEWPDELQVVVDEHGVSEIYWGVDDPPPPEDSPRTYVPLARLEAVEAKRDQWRALAGANRRIHEATVADFVEAKQQRDTLIERLREIADCPNKGTKAESTDGQAWNDRAWVIQRAHHALKDIGEGSEDAG